MVERQLGKGGVTCGGLLAVLRAFLTVGDGSGLDSSSARYSSEGNQKYYGTESDPSVSGESVRY